MDKSFYFFYLFLTSFISIAQEYELKLTVVDLENDKPLESVNVLINASKGGGIT